MQDFSIDKYMKPVVSALDKYGLKPDAWTDIYNRAWEAVNNAIRDASQPCNAADGAKRPI